MKTPKTITSLFKEERDSIAVPSRAEFHGIVSYVTKEQAVRSTREDAKRSSLGSIILSKKAFLVLATALVIVIVTIPKRPFIHNAIPVLQSSPASPAAQVASSVSNETDAIIVDIMNDIAVENTLLQNEFTAEQNIGDDSDILDTILIS